MNPFKCEPIATGPLPAGVPVNMRSPVLSVQKRLIYAIISSTEKSICDVLAVCTVSPQIESELSSFFSTLYPNASQEFQSDLVAAARAACGHAPGIAAIVGTGSNSCLYDGEKIVSKVCSGGFILGDEGSAATLGRLFLSDFIKGLVPSEIAGSFASRYPSDYTSIISNVYHCEGSPSGYLGSFAPFIMEHYAHPYIKELVDGNFRSFIRRSLKQHDTGRYAVGVVGGFAYALKDIFSRIAEEEGVTVSRFVKAPIEGLVDFHR